MAWIKEKWVIIQKTKTLRDYVYDDHPADAYKLAQEIIMDLENARSQLPEKMSKRSMGADRKGVGENGKRKRSAAKDRLEAV